ncbi:MAG TPA: hypothetical protein DCE83_11155 [Enterococcus sp.]|nr:hypothetical protein [Enterococcus sp.]
MLDFNMFYYQKRYNLAWFLQFVGNHILICICVLFIYILVLLLWKYLVILPFIKCCYNRCLNNFKVLFKFDFKHICRYI